MSAVNIFPDDDRVELWTDAAAYSADDGEILAFLQKVIILEDINAAITAQGDLRLLAALEQAMPGTYGSYDALVDHLEGMAAGMWEPLDGQGFLPTIVKAVGWSDERQRLETWSVSMGETIHHEPGAPKMLPAGAVHVSPGSPELFARLAKAGLMDGNDLRCDTEDERLGIMRVQCSCKFPYEVAGGRQIKMVGGWAQRTVVRRGSVSTAIVERWPDEVGPRGRAAMAA